MSRFSGRQFKGASKVLREERKIEAHQRFEKSAHSSTGRRAAAGELSPVLYVTVAARRGLDRLVTRRHRAA